MLTVRNLSVSFGRADVLRDVTTAFPEEITALVGRNGAGKSTLLNALCGLIKPQAGSVFWDGKSTFADPATRRRFKRSLGWVPQHIDLPNGVTAFDFVKYCAWMGGMKKNVGVAARQALALVDLETHPSRSATKLSGGQQRRLMIACAMVKRPDVLILDEPTAGLDPEQREHLHAIIRNNPETRTVIVATHLVEDVLGVSTRLVSLEGGRVAAQWSTADLEARARQVAGTAREELRQIRKLMYQDSEA